MSIQQPYSVFFLYRKWSNRALPLSLLFFLINVHCASGKQEGNSPIGFTENKGQIIDQFDKHRSDILFSSQVDGMNVFLKKDGISYQQYQMESVSHDNGFYLRTEKQYKFLEKATENNIVLYRLDIQWLNANQNSILEKEKPLEGVEHFYLAGCPEGVMNVKSYQSILYKELYSGIDLNYYIKDRKLKYDYLGAAGSDYHQIQWKVEGAERIEINRNGELVLYTPLGKVREQAPVVFQGNKKLAARWCVKENVISFSIDRLDPSRPYIIDPLVRNWGTYYGSDQFEAGAGGCTTDQYGNVYLAGLSRSSSNIATVGAHQTACGGGDDTFLVKFDILGARQWCTYFGGSSTEGIGLITTDLSGNIYMTGNTRSSGLATPGSHIDIYPGGYTGFLVKFSNNGARLWSTYYGNGGDTGGAYCFADDADNIYILGTTHALTSIATPGAWQTSFTGFTGSYFLAKFTTSGVLLWSTYIGENIWATVGYVDVSGNIYVTGAVTDSNNGISNNGGWLNSFAGGISDAFLLKLNDNGGFIWSVYVGGPGNELGFGCLGDSAGDIYILGSTSSISGIATSGSWQNTFGGGLYDGFLAKYTNTGIVNWATYSGGEEDDDLYKGTFGSDGYLYVGGGTLSTTGIATSDAWQPTYNATPAGYNNVYIAQFDVLGSRYHGTYYGGEGYLDIEEIASDNFGNIYLAGCTTNPNSLDIASADGWQPNYVNRGDSYLVQFSIEEPLPVTWTNIESSCENGRRRISWSTASEKNNDVFIIQYSKDGKNFYNKTEVKSKGNSTSSQSYIFIDHQPDEATYFRIAQRDQNQLVTYSTIVKMADCNDSIGSSLFVFPNPSSGKFAIRLDQPADLFVSDELGRLVYEKTSHPATSEISMELAGGVYFMKVVFITGEVKTIRLISW